MHIISFLNSVIILKIRFMMDFSKETHQNFIVLLKGDFTLRLVGVPCDEPPKPKITAAAKTSNKLRNMFEDSPELMKYPLQMFVSWNCYKCDLLWENSQTK